MADERKLGYLLSQYPAVSHTFFLSEITALRERGFQIETASINQVTPPNEGFSHQELTECAGTYYVKSGPKAVLLSRIVRTALTHPLVVMRGLREAVRLAPLNIAATVYSLFYLAEALLVGVWMREKRCNHLHVHFSGPVATVGLLASAAWQVPYSLTVHGPDEFFEMDKFYLRRKIEQAKFVICISDFCRSQLLRIAPPASQVKFHVCRLGVDEKVFRPVKKAPAAALRLTSVGRLHPSKGQRTLLAAVAQLLHHGFIIEVDLIGGGVDRADLERVIAEKGLERSVTIYGATSHARTRLLLERCDLFVLASFAEGVPIALMEAMAMEIPCVSTYVGGIPELIRPGEEGLLVAPSSVEELSEAIAKLAQNPELCRLLAIAGRAKVISNYNLARNTDRLAEIFERLI